MKISYLFILFLIFSFINDLVFPITKSWCVAVGVIFLYVSLFAILIFKKKPFINDILHIAKNKHNSLWVYLTFFIYITILTLIQGFLGHTKMPVSIIAVLLLYGLFLLPCYLVSTYTSYKILKPKQLIKIIYLTFYIILLLGIVDFCSYILNIVPLQKFISLSHNIELIALGATQQSIQLTSLGYTRMRSVYFEAGFFAEYIFLMLPIMYSLSLSKYKILKNKYINTVIKKTTIPLIWLDLVLTRSPIWLVLSLISTAIYFGICVFKNFKKNPQKYLMILSIILVLICISVIPMSRINVQKTYLGRIVTVLENITDINVLIMAEESLGTRLSNIINIIHIGMQSPIFGVGHSNLIPNLEKKVLYGKSTIAITPEMYAMTLKKKPSFQNPPLSNIFCKFGIVALFLYYLFILKTILALKKSLKFSSGIIYNFIYGLTGTICSYIVISCYDITINNILSAMLIGISIGLTQKIFMNVKQEKLKNQAIEMVDENIDIPR